MLFVRAYPSETQEMVFDAHDRAFAFFRGACRRGLYDKERGRVYNRRLLQMCARSPPARLRPAERRVRSRTRSDWCASASSRRASGSSATASSTPGCSTTASPMPRLTATRAPGPDGLVHVRGRAPRVVLYAGRFDNFHTLPAAVSKTVDTMSLQSTLCQSRL